MIVILGKPGCDRCSSAQDHLTRMGLDYVYATLDGSSWRAAGTCATEALAAAALADIDLNRPPIIYADGTAYEYAAGMKACKAIARKDTP